VPGHRFPTQSGRPWLPFPLERRSLQLWQSLLTRLLFANLMQELLVDLELHLSQCRVAIRVAHLRAWHGFLSGELLNCHFLHQGGRRMVQLSQTGRKLIFIYRLETSSACAT